MKFKLRCSADILFGSETEKRDKLAKLGFSFKVIETNDTFFGQLFKVDDDTLTINIDTLEELVEFIDTYGEIVMNKNSIEIYNDYRE